MVSTTNKAITVYIRNGDLDGARKLFDTMSVKNIISWNSILAGYSKKAGHLKEARELFERIPNPDVVSFNTMITCYFHNTDVDGARRLFDGMLRKDLASWNSMISGLSKNGLVNEAAMLFSAMPYRNNVSWNAVVSGYVRMGDIDKAEEYYKKASERDDVILQTAMITGYMNSRRVGCAEKLFGMMKLKNLVTWNAMVAGYVENNQSENGLKLFRVMIRDMMANPSTLSSALLGCSNLSSLFLGRQIHQLSLKSPSYSDDPSVGTSLLSMYSKCGELEDARKVFDMMTLKDVVAWNAMISGYAHHGIGRTSHALFNKMINEKKSPDWITFVAVLTACAHTGMVELGWHYFHSMVRDHGVDHTPDHYSCMVDLLCRAGSVSEAARLIRSMPFKPHEAVYGMLLSACRRENNVELAEYAAKNLLEMEPRNCGGYVQLANVYASARMWSDVSKVRIVMKESKVVKTPGYSWIEVGDGVHEFRSGDRMHPQLDSVVCQLKELEKRMKDEGKNKTI